MYVVNREEKFGEGACWSFLRWVGRLGEEGGKAEHRDELFNEDNLQGLYVNDNDGDEF